MTRHHWLLTIALVMLILKFGWLDPLNRLHHAHTAFIAAHALSDNLKSDHVRTDSDWAGILALAQIPLPCERPTTTINLTNTGYTARASCSD